MTGDLAASGLFGRAPAWLDERTARVASGVWVRAGLVRMALRRRDRIPELAVLALEQDARAAGEFPAT